MKTFVTVAALVLSSTLAFAADLAPKKALPVKAVPAPVFSWTGFYFGGTVGYAFDNEHSFSTVGNDEHTREAILSGKHASAITNSGDGFTGGGEIGYNYQFANSALFGSGGVVIGVEADIQYVGPGSSTIYTTPGSSPVEYYTSKTDYLGTVRGRLGYAFDRLLVYGTGGWAYGRFSDSHNIFSPSGRSAFNTRSSDGSGYAVGGGLAYAVPLAGPFGVSAAILKAEYLYYDLGSADMFVQAPSAGRSFTSNVDVTGNLVRVGLDFKFN